MMVSCGVCREYRGSPLWSVMPVLILALGRVLGGRL